MQVTFRYTNTEYKTSRRLNRLLGMPRWKSYGLAIICLLPSLMLVWISGSTISLIAFALMIVSLVLLSLLTAIREPPCMDQHDHTMTFTETSKHEKTSHSEFETDWRNYDEFTESDSSFIFRKLERFTLIPKRVIPPEQVVRFRGYAASVNEAPGDTPISVPLFDRLFVTPPPDSVYRFVYHPRDLVDALADPLVMVNNQRSSVRSRRNRFGIVWLILFVSLMLYFVLVPPRQIPWGNPSSLLQIGLVISAIVLPFVLIRALNAWLRSRGQNRSHAVPPEENRMRLMNSGWAIGSSRSAIFYDWRDIDGFYENRFCFGFKTFNELIQVIPKRIFSEPSQAQAFLDRAMTLWREHRRKFEEAVVANETGNPYQPPAT